VVLEITDFRSDLIPTPSSEQISILGRANSAQRRFRRLSRRSSIGPNPPMKERARMHSLGGTGTNKRSSGHPCSFASR
jgi:hypothetical protein